MSQFIHENTQTQQSVRDARKASVEMLTDTEFMILQMNLDVVKAGTEAGMKVAPKRYSEDAVERYDNLQAALSELRDTLQDDSAHWYPVVRDFLEKLEEFNTMKCVEPFSEDQHFPKSAQRLSRIGEAAKTMASSVVEVAPDNKWTKAQAKRIGTQKRLPSP